MGEGEEEEMMGEGEWIIVEGKLEQYEEVRGGVKGYPATNYPSKVEQCYNKQCSHTYYQRAERKENGYKDNAQYRNAIRHVKKKKIVLCKEAKLQKFIVVH